ncbi:HAD family hydrolase [Kitasatospora sp. NPDC001119]|uniref:HAD family hydrolase n=1 Tax=unclassified Kitasatospora TaxID=2633591 RepID=UPI0006711564|nr:HAD-IA family hydrolase [Kitasatospora sp. MY 5-36]
MTSAPTPGPALPAVLFDAADTLVELVPAIPELLSTAWLGRDGAPDTTAVRQALWAIGSEGDWPDDEPDPERRLAMWSRFCREALRRAGGNASAEAAERAARHILDPARYRAYPDAVPCLRALRAAGHPLALVSNFDRWLRDILDGTGLTGLFDTVVISSEVGLEKPGPEIFVLACERLGRPPGECVFVGDSVVIDVEGAQRAGLHPVLLDRYARFPGFTGPRVTTLDGFAALATHLPIPAGRTAQ